MYTNDPIGDLLTRLRNAVMRGKEVVDVPSSKMLQSIANILHEEGFLSGIAATEDSGKPILELTIRYDNGKPVIRELTRISKPGVRRYIGYKDIKKVKNGQGIAILSTPKGVMTAQKARSEQVGGEYLCEIW